ncbi:uncharacterized protein LOC119575159 [Penaeus monodon]|uniref:uncharacterized protein LOC119575159 n=1 Tax=Penaeus monodon TaxID=6687 RepID=UPI0018A71E4A|nr:uncharacterized protein LOC119575159 [Penaeus monodon]XP_037778567.1 uncharacterized protein LOC119575159 [Penaeus monodon]
MWSSVVGGTGGEVPCARHKHAVCAAHPHVYLLGGRHGNLPLKDFWVYDLVTRTWREVRDDSGARPPSLQQHTMVDAGDKLVVFGGELCMSNETPLWIYHPQTRMWRKWRWAGAGASGARMGGGSERGRIGGASGPTGRRGHTALMAGDSMIIYGGYQDLRGSSSEIWSFNVVEETWSQISSRGEQPAGRHAHSAVLYDNQMWVYGGMTDLQERNDFWRFDTVGRTWTQIRSRPNPGYLHSHVAAKLHSSMVIFGGERQGEVLNELWRFHFGTSTWERLMPSGIRPQPRSQFCAFVAPSHYIKGPRFYNPSSHSGFGSSSASSGSYTSSVSHDSYRTRRVHPDDSVSNSGGVSRNSGGSGGPNESECACQECVDAEDEDLDPSRLRSLIQKNCSNAPTNQLKLSISKFSQLNLSHLGRYYSYSMLSNDSTESIVEESLASTCDSVNSKIVKSQSIHVMNKDKNLKAGGAKGGMTRDIASVPNFGDIKDSCEEEARSGAHHMPVNHIKVITVLPAESAAEATLEDDPSDLVAGIKGRLAFTNDEAIQSADTSISENLMSFSCTTDSNLSSNTNLGSISNYTMSGPNSFSNPNYVGFDPGRDPGGLLSQDYWTTGALDLESIRHKEFAEMLRTPPDSGIGLGVEMERRTPLDFTLATLEDFVTIDNHSARFSRNTKVHPAGTEGSPASSKPSKVKFCTEQTSSAGSRNSRNSNQDQGEGGSREPPPPRINPFMKPEPLYEPTTPSAMYIMGGKETDQMTVFKRPISIWKLDLPF